MKRPINPFHFKRFSVRQDHCLMKVGTDGILLGAWARVEGLQRGLDIGTGSGLIALMLAQRSELTAIHGVEIDRPSYKETQANFTASPWSDRLKVFHVSIQEYALQSPPAYDLIISNPPFFSGGTFSHYQDRNAVRHTIKLSHGDLLVAVQNLLTEHGRFQLVLPLIEGLRFIERAAAYRLYCTRLTEVRSRAEKQVERLLMQFERKPHPLQKDELVILEPTSNEWSAEFKELTRNFYLKI